MEDRVILVETLIEKTQHYAGTVAELYKLKTVAKGADIISALFAKFAIVPFIVLFLMIFNVGIALWIGELLGKSYYGFFIVSGFYAMAGIVIFLFRKRLIKEPLRNSIIVQVLK